MSARIASLTDRRLLVVSGPDAAHFLHNIVTCEIEALQPGKASFGALLTPQGKILFDFFVIRRDDRFLLDVAADKAEELAKRLAFYRLRARVTVEPADPQWRIFAAWGGDQPGGGETIAIADPRLAQMGYRLYGPAAPEGEAGDYDAHRIALGMPQGGLDYPFADTFPHEALMDQFGGVDFAKGCYVGQEVVSRMQHRGTARSRVVMVEGDGALPAIGTAITAGGKTAGTMGSSSGSQGLALLRLDRVRDATEAGGAVKAGDTSVAVNIQPWTGFDWPQDLRLAAAGEAPSLL